MKTVKFKIGYEGEELGTTKTSDWVEVEVDGNLALIDVFFMMYGTASRLGRRDTIEKSRGQDAESHWQVNKTEDYDGFWLYGMPIRFYVGHEMYDDEGNLKGISTGYVLYEKEDQTVKLPFDVNYLCFELPDDFIWPEEKKDEETKDEVKSEETADDAIKVSAELVEDEEAEE